MASRALYTRVPVEEEGSLSARSSQSSRSFSSSHYSQSDVGTAPGSSSDLSSRFRGIFGHLQGSRSGVRHGSFQGISGPEDFTNVENPLEEQQRPLVPYCTVRGLHIIEDAKEESLASVVFGYSFDAVVALAILCNLTLAVSNGTPGVSGNDCCPDGLCDEAFDCNADVVCNALALAFVAELVIRCVRFAVGGCATGALEGLQRSMVLVDTLSIVAVAALRCIPETRRHPATYWQLAAAAGAGRLFRLMYILRTLGDAVRRKFASLDWVESGEFQWLVAAVILVNALTLGVEMDYPSPAWFWINQAMLAFFMFELLSRIWRSGARHFFVNSEEVGWNLLDFFIMIISVLDIWVVVFADILSGMGMSVGLGNLMMVVRMLRILRILRLLRLFRAFRPLHALAICMTEAMQSIFWVLVLTIVAIYAVAILATRMIGHGMLVSDPDDIPPETRALFSGVWDSMFTLFSVMNGEEWNKVEPLLDRVPATKPAFLIFIILSSWALLSTLTGVVSDHMMVVRESDSHRSEEAEEKRMNWQNNQLRSVFHAADRDGSGSLAREEYLALLRSPFHVKKLQQVANISVKDLAMMFDLLDVDGNGVLDWDEFLHGFDWLNEAITGKSLLKIRHAIGSKLSKLQHSISDVSCKVQDLGDREEANHYRIQEALREALAAKKRCREATAAAAAAAEEREAARRALNNLMAAVES
eukprot:TRINITY_DN37812_c0_g1_i1.p1 TRINITY_DN37812_c0_g1~~TRINITY_DN37812_c0_g1_i1.p1  ORF type:complete len:701 (-),score=184.80 TRINITY_DN37812_c0_g1_i1:58-2160(-)